MFALSDLFPDEIYLTGQRASSGLYREVGSGREIWLEPEELLPRTPEGRPASYVCVYYTWNQQHASPASALATHAPADHAIA